MTYNVKTQLRKFWIIYNMLMRIVDSLNDKQVIQFWENIKDSLLECHPVSSDAGVLFMGSKNELHKRSR